ncbi:cytochrome-c oxidase, cbb3-type subunit III [Rhodobacteraceae bacterium]|nr:cytochrome-c oxidase, cbb3-type subunit III [Paracoccaceae bacterium]
MSKQDNKNDVPTTGHSWDGIEEFDNPMPRWWLWTFYACIVWAIGYTIAYPAWPMIKSATPGLLGFSTRAQVETQISDAELANAVINDQLATVELTEISADPELLGYAKNKGAAVFRTWCAQCHGSGAAGVQANGYPNLLDNDWLWGGTIDDIHTTITHGIRNTADEDARFSQMPAFGEILEPTDIHAVANYVMSLSGDAQDPSVVEAGATVFMDNCSACHAEDGTGDRFQGAPNLTDAIWLYGNGYDNIVKQISVARNGVMPNWNTRLDEAEIRAVATYVHSLGGGEATE